MATPTTPATPTPPVTAATPVAEKPEVPVHNNVSTMLNHHLENMGLKLNGLESSTLVKSIVVMIKSGGHLPEDIMAAFEARKAEAADHAKQAADAIEMNKPKG